MTEAATIPANPSATWRTRVAAVPVGRADLLLAGAVAAIFVANLIVSFAIQGHGIWQVDRAEGYWLHFTAGLVGLHLVGPIIFIVGEPFMPGRQVYWSGPVGPGLVLLVLAWLMVIVILALPRQIPMWRRFVWAWLMGTQIASFAAVHYSTLGN